MPSNARSCQGSDSEPCPDESGDDMTLRASPAASHRAGARSRRERILAAAAVSAKPSTGDRREGSLADARAAPRIGPGLPHRGRARPPDGRGLFRRLCRWRIVLVVTVVDVFELGEHGRLVLLAHLHESDTELARHLDQDPDAGQHVQGGEDLQHVMGEHEIVVSDARRGERADGEVEPVDETPPLTERVDHPPCEHEGARGTDDRGEGLFPSGAPDRTCEAIEHASKGGHFERLQSVAKGRQRQVVAASFPAASISRLKSSASASIPAT